MENLRKLNKEEKDIILTVLKRREFTNNINVNKLKVSYEHNDPWHMCYIKNGTIQVMGCAKRNRFGRQADKLDFRSWILPFDRAIHNLIDFIIPTLPTKIKLPD